MIALWMLGCIEGRAPVGLELSFEPQVPESVVLESATLEVSDVHLLAPAFAVSMPSIVGTAWAHPGHDFAGPVRGEWLGDWTLDLQRVQSLGEGEGHTGTVETASFAVHRLHLEGTREGLEFAVDVDVEAVLEGVPAAIALETEWVELVLTLDVDAALEPVDWEDTSGDGRLDGSDTGFVNSVRFGLMRATAWTVEER